MATYLKRTSKLFDLSLSGLSAEVHLRDLICPVCRGILIEPVTLPCTHNLCLRCLKGTFEHNSLSCPLCRLRVGSWLRTATKSKTLVNHGLWELIRAKFPKEVEDKHNGEERDLGLVDADFATNRILSAAGEIHREYEVQLQMAEEEMRRQRHAEQIASEALIQKIQAEEQQQLLAQLAQDQLLAKTLVKKQIVEKQKETAKCYSGCLNTSMSNYAFDASKFNIKVTHVNNVQASQAEAVQVESRTSLPGSVRDSSELRRANMVLLHKIRADKHCKVKMNASSTYKDYCPKQSATHNTAVTRTLKHQMVSKFIQPYISNYNTDPGCSTSRAYVTETKEELRVPSDVVNSKKKSLGIEVCMTHGSLGPNRTADDERIGSAESSGSHDSINQEIHHFKPIKTVPRTPLKVSSDGKPIESKLLRVIPIMKRIINAVPKPPSPTHMKRIIGCSWSAFREVRQDAKEKQATNNVVMDTGTSIDQKPSTSLSQSQTFFNKSTKLETNNARFDFIPEPSYDNNKNYTKNTDKTINSTKASKKLSSNDELDTRKTRKSWRASVRNGIVTKSNRYRNASSSRKRADFSLDAKDEEENDSSGSNSPFDKTSLQNDEFDEDDDVAVENIAERIKKRKVNTKTKTLKPKPESDVRSKRSARKRVLSASINKSSAMDQVSSSRQSARLNRSSMLRSKRRRICNSQSNTEHPEKNESSMDATTSSKAISGLKRSARNVISTRVSSKRGNSESDGTRDKYSGGKYDYDSPPESCDETEECVSEENDDVGISEKKEFSDDEVIEEQQRMERLLLQERQDFELARRLQTKYDEMERIAGRTRRSRRAVEGAANIDVTDLREIDAARVVHKASGATRKRSIHVRRKSIVPNKKRGRPPKRVKQDEICTR